MAGHEVVWVPTVRGISVRRLEGSAGRRSVSLVPNRQIFTISSVRTSDVSQRPGRFVGAFEKLR